MLDGRAFTVAESRISGASDIQGVLEIKGGEKSLITVV